MLKKLLLVVVVIALSCSSFAQAFYKLEGEDAVTLSTLSFNGMYACNSMEGVAYLYDFAAKQMTVMEGGYYVDGVSDSGIFVGSQSTTITVDGKEVQAEVPAYIKNGESTQLPLPAGYTDGAGRGISVDGSLIIGYANQSGLTMRRPCVWTLQSGTYVPTLLPTYEKDFTDREPQGVDALRCSSTGDVIVGRMVDWTGMICSMIVWNKNEAGSWEMKDLGKDIIFKEGAVIPSIPDPEAPVAMEYFTAQDSVAYNKDLEDYAAGLISENPEWNKQKYITNPDSIAKYNEAAAEYNAILDIAAQKTEELFACLTDKSIDVYSVVLSGNGKYAGTICTMQDPEGGDSGPLSLGARSGGSLNSPLCFDLQKGTWSIKDYIKDGITDGITDNGDIFFATPYMERTRTSFVIPAGTNDVIDMGEWVKRGTNGVVDLKSDFSFSYEYDDYMSGEHIVVTDSLIVGDVFPSANGRVLLGTFYSPVAPEIITYFVNMDDPESIENMDANNESVTVYPNPATDMIYVKGNIDGVSVSDLSGRTVYESSCISGSIPVDTLPEGVYLLKVKSEGKTTTHKVFVKN